MTVTKNVFYTTKIVSFYSYYSSGRDFVETLYYELCLQAYRPYDNIIYTTEI